MNSRRWINAVMDDPEPAWMEDVAQALSIVLRWLVTILLSNWSS